MDRYRKAAIYTLITFFVFTSFVMLSEIPLLPASQRVLYVLTKFPFIFAALPLAYFLRKDIMSPTLNALVGIDFICYAVQGQCFRPLYFFSYTLLIIVYAFLFPVSKRIFRSIVIGGFVAFISVLLYHWDQLVEQLQHPAKSDIILALLSFAVVAWLSNLFFTSERLFREESVLKFAKIGTQTSRVIHDLKGFANSPLLYLQFLESKLPSPVDNEVKEAMELLSRDLDGFRNILLELNQLTTSKLEERSKFHSGDIVSSLQIILKKQLVGVQLRQTGSICLETDKSLLTSIFLNILMNSIEAYKERKKEGAQILIQVDKNRVTFRDQAGGFDKVVLRNISNGRFVSTRPNGSGLGLLFVFDGMRKIGGKVKIYNIGKDACIELQFPKRIMVQQGIKDGPLPITD